MFTGIIVSTGIIKEIQVSDHMRLMIEAGLYQPLTIGDSVACNGICLTITSVEEEALIQRFTLDLSQETLQQTTAKDWQKGDHLNLEPALKVGDLLSGHMVQGHVDGVGLISHISNQEGNYAITVRAPQDLMPFIAKKGSITLDGISLTVNAISGEELTITAIPYTLSHTNLQHKKQGDTVNIEIDVLARYMARYSEAKEKQDATK